MRFVTTHAVLRYLERVLLLGPEIDASVPRPCSERRRVEAGCAIVGMTVDEIADLICPPRLHRAREMGPRAIVAAGYRMPVRDGVAVTVLTDGMHP